MTGPLCALLLLLLLLLCPHRSPSQCDIRRYSTRPSHAPSRTLRRCCRAACVRRRRAQRPVSAPCRARLPTACGMLDIVVSLSHTRQMKNPKQCPVCRGPVLKLQRVCCSRECSLVWRSQMSTGKNNPDWKGGRYIEPGKGYVLVRNKEHPRSRQNGYVLEHILVMEKKLGRLLARGEVVHHVDHNPANNHPDNLVLYSGNGEHLRVEGHHRKRQPPCRCGRAAIARGLCSRHYAQVQRTGKTLDLD